MPVAAAVDRAFVRALPKIELHAHLSGSIARETLHDIWAQRKQAEPALALADPLVAIPPGKVDYDLETFFPLFSQYIYQLCSDLPSIAYSTDAVLDAFRADGVVHLELRTTPRAIPQHAISKPAYVSAVLDRIRAHNLLPDNPMRTSLILSVDRRNTAAEAEQVVSLAIALRDRGVVGVDLCGNPAVGDVAIFSAAFARARDAGLRITVHFAEAPASSTEQELAALLAWHPDRLGHVIHVPDALKAAIVERGIGVELCLSCNVHAKMITGSFKDHHFGWWRDAGVGVALSTDDVGVFCSPLSEEYLIAAQHFGLEKSDIRKLVDGAVDIVFADEAEKERLRSMISEWPGWE